MPTGQALGHTDTAARRVAVRASVAENAAFDMAYGVMNVLATIVAAYGLLANSPAVIIGAMVIAMLLGPIAGIGLALVDGDQRLLRTAATALVGGVLLVLGTGWLVGRFHTDLPATREMLARTAPNLFDLMVALGGGAAGAYAAISPRLNVAFVGVAIATALVPPLTTCSLFLARGDFALAAGAFLLALTNIVAIQCAYSVVFFVYGFHGITARAARTWGAVVENGVSVVALGVLGLVMAANLHAMVGRELYENTVRQTLRADLTRHPEASLVDVRFRHTGERTLVYAVVRGPTPFSAAQVAEMERTLPPPPGQRGSVLWVRYVHTTEMSGQGPVSPAEDPAGALSGADPDDAHGTDAG